MVGRCAGKIGWRSQPARIESSSVDTCRKICSGCFQADAPDLPKTPVWGNGVSCLWVRVGEYRGRSLAQAQNPVACAHSRGGKCCPRRQCLSKSCRVVSWPLGFGEGAPRQKDRTGQYPVWCESVAAGCAKESAMNRSHIARAKAIRNLVTERGKGDGNCRPYSAQPIAACYRGTRAERTTRRVHRGQTWLPLQVSFPFTVCSIPYEIEQWNFSTRKTRARHTHLSKSPPLPGTKGTVTSPACAVL